MRQQLDCKKRCAGRSNTPWDLDQGMDERVFHVSIFSGRRACYRIQATNWTFFSFQGGVEKHIPSSSSRSSAFLLAQSFCSYHVSLSLTVCVQQNSKTKANHALGLFRLLNFSHTFVHTLSSCYCHLTLTPASSPHH